MHKAFVGLLIILLMPLSAYAVPDRIIGTEAGTGIMEEMTPEDASALIGGGTDLPTDTITTSESAPLKIRGTGGQSSNGINIYQHSGGTPTWKCVIANVEGDCNIIVKIDSGNYWELQDSSGNSIIKIDPGASGAARFAIGANYRLRKTISFLADALYMNGCTLVTDAALVTGGLIEPYITCGDNSAHGFHRSLGMPDSWDGAGLTFTPYLINVNATPANDYEIKFSADCKANSEALGTTISTTGQQAALFDFDNSGTCGTACAQFDLAKVTTATVTPNGTCAGGNLLRVQAQINATNTTTAQVADVKIIGVNMEYAVTSWSD